MSTEQTLTETLELKTRRNLTLERTALLAETETRHDFLVHEDLLQLSSLRTSRKRRNFV